MSGGAPWLSVSPTHGSTPTQVTMAVTPTGLMTGTYISQITFSAAGATDSPHVVDVTFHIGTMATNWVYLPIVLRP